MPYLCFEFHRFRLGDARRCAERIRELGPAEFQASLYMQHRFHFAEWRTADELFAFLEEHPHAELTGDIYVRSRGD